MAGVSVGRSYVSAAFIVPIVLLLVFVGLTVGCIHNRSGYELWLALAGVCFIWTIVAAGYVRKGQRTLEITADGFQIEDLSGTHDYRDEQVTQIRYKSVINYSNGTASSSTDSVDVGIDEAGVMRWIPMNLQHKFDEGSILNQLASRLLKKVIERGRATLNSGAAIQGEAWSWTGESLTITEKGRAAQTIRVADVTNIDLFDNHMCVWTAGADLPTARVPEFSSNVHMLSALLNEKMPDRDGAASSGLGRVLFERKASRFAVIASGVFSALFALAFLITAITSIIHKDPNGGFLALFLLVIAIPVQLYYSSNKRAYFRCHENGVSQRGIFSQNELRYDEIATFTYQATRHYHNGAYTGTVMRLLFFPTKSSGDKPIKYSATVQNADEALDRLRGHISGVMAKVLYKAYQAGTPIVWTNNIRLIPGEGIEYKPAGFIGRKDPVKYAWDDVTNFDLQKGFLHVWVRDNEKSVVQESCSTANFFPGLTLFAMLMKHRGVAKELVDADAST